ncbi:glycoside hydrolase family 3 C-terminal domain-containing protein [Crossiella sp. SN42]|uniref:glycoside hydrolase family 3 C-terminal domain-containing protein n=1 Tax=Crossiella sp. SN42 TaxID=2944808 RepID=UPI00207D05EB|nr:glycoside hydrolase family 3 C-terminal domain-containing protein [Crossiella sp. SN42]MCO1576944.1 glycoside hydrolase family 3 C-terminal domain-containing protein [Crossiella sp. SN42]
MAALSRPTRRRTGRGLAALLAVLACASALAPAAQAEPDHRFRDPRLPLQTRVDDLLRRLTLPEKVSLLHQYQPAIPRLGVRSFKTGTEALHGIGWTTDKSTGGSVVTAAGTVFPQAIGLASTWNPELVRQVGAVVGTEARGYHAENPDVWGLQLWAPVVNLLRDPRWGRNEEGYSEDAHLTGVLSTAYGKGVQGPDPDRLRAAPVLKHYLANNNETRRTTTSSNLPPRVKKEYEEAAFKAAISADAATGVMMAYNLINGRPATAHADANEVIRSWTKRELFNVTDAAGPNNLVQSQRYYADRAEADAATLKAGVESFTVDDTDSSKTVNAVNTALSRGLIAESDVDTAVRRMLSVRFRLGEFDPDGGPYGHITKDVVNSPEHQRLNRKAAAEAMVLLKNERGLLPLDPARAKKVAVVGPLADTLYTDWYSGSLPYRVTPRQGIAERLGAGGSVAFNEGVDRIALRTPDGRYVTAPADGSALTVTGAGAGQHFDSFDWGEGVLALRAAANNRYVSYGTGGTLVSNAEQPNGWYVQQQFKLTPHGAGHVLEYAGNETDEGWFGDKKYVVAGADGKLTVSAATPAAATTFTKETVSSGVEQAVRAVRGADAAVVVVGSMPFISGREDDDRADLNLAAGQQKLVEAVRAANPNTIVVLENSYPTTINWIQQHVPSVLWTSHAGAETGNALADVLFGAHNPTGRLTQTWYRSERDLPSLFDYDIIKNDRTYQYFRGNPLYPFGHGLSYTEFGYRNLRLSKPVVAADGEVTVSVEVTNTGARAGEEVVQLYTHQRASRDKQPLRQLRGFDRVRLNPGETKAVRLTLRAADLAHWDVTRNRWVVENSPQDIMVGRSATDIRQQGTLFVRGETIPARELTGPARAVDFDDYRGVDLVDETKVRGDAVGATAGDWIKFSDVRLNAKSLTAAVARAAPGETTVQLRLDDPVRGPVIGTATVPSTGDAYRYTTITAPLTGAHGRRDVYLVFGGDLRISSLSLR